MKNTLVLIFNAIIVAICAIACYGYLAKPYFKLDASYVLTEEKFKEFMGDKISPEDDYSVAFGKNGVTLAFTVQIDNSDLIGAFKETDGLAFSNGFIEKIVEQVVTGIEPTFEEIANGVVKVATKKTLTDEMKSLVSDHVGEGVDVDEVLKNAGIDDEYITKTTDTLIDALFKDDATVSGVVDLIADSVNDVFNKLSESGNSAFDGIACSEADKQEIKAQLTETLDSLDLSDGDKIKSADQILASLLAGMLHEKYDVTAEDKSANTVSPLNHVVFVEDPEEGEEKSLKETLTEIILDKIPESTVPQTVLKIMGGVVAFSMFAWAYVVLKILFKLFSRNKGVKVGFPIVFGWITQLILGFGISFGAKFFIWGLLPFLSAFSSALSGLTLSSVTSGFIASICAGVLFLLCFIYIPVRRNARRNG